MLHSMPQKIFRKILNIFKSHPMKRLAGELFSLIKGHLILLKLKKRLPKLKNVDVLILGSAPHPNLPKNHESMYLVCCNGSAANAKILNLGSPKMTVVDYELIDPVVSNSKSVRSDITKNELLKDIDLGLLISTQSNHSIGGAPEILKARFSGFFPIQKSARRILINSITGTKMMELDVNTSLCSTGGFAVALSLFLGARSVSISGFTFISSSEEKLATHFYPTSAKEISTELNTRNHSLADSALIALAVINGYKIYTLERDLLPLTQNWGNTSR